MDETVDSLQEMDETVIRKSASAWSASHCHQDPSREESRGNSGELDQYPTLPRPIPTHLQRVTSSSEFEQTVPSSFSLESPSLSLLTKQETKDYVMCHEGSQFPAAKHLAKGQEGVVREKREVVRRERGRKVMWISLVCLLLLLAFVLQYMLVVFVVAPLVHNSQVNDDDKLYRVNQTVHA